MTLASGTKLGPYEIISALGAGGMGEVYKARDTRLKRDVAVKVLPESFAKDPARLARFEREARTLAALNHPNILFILDVGEQDGTPYVVTELLEGQSLRQALAGGPLSVHRAVEIASQIARGLAAAHAKGVVHRDLKPGNVFITKEGQVKVLDFGLARVEEPALSPLSQLSQQPTAETPTGPGVTLGTIGYMAPEQVRGETADARSDLFSFGVVLYEMLSGKRPFERGSSADTLSAILKEDPSDLTRADAPLPPALVRMVNHCLEKAPEARFQSARDVAFDLETLSGLSSASLAAEAAGPKARLFNRRSLLVAAAGATALLTAAVLAAFYLGRSSVEIVQPTFQRLTFRRGFVDTARFMPEGQTVVYSASWEGSPSELFSIRVDGPESTSLGHPDSLLMAVSPRSELALMQRHLYRREAFWRSGTLALAPFSGGSPRPLQEKVSFADWSPDGKELALIRRTDTGQQLEYPSGTVLFRTAGLLSHPRVSPSGDLVAFLSHPVTGDNGGTVEVVDRRGKSRTLAGPFAAGVEGLAWSPRGDEVWFTALVAGSRSQTASLIAVNLGGRQRFVLAQPNVIRLHDIAKDGSALVSSDVFKLSLFFDDLSGAAPRPLPWLDTSVVSDLSADGRKVLFVESPGVGSSPYWFYLRDTDGSPPVKILEGSAGWAAFSEDGRSIVIPQLEPPSIYVYPLEAGEPVLVKLQDLVVQEASLLSDGKTLLFEGHEPSKPLRMWRTDLSGTKPRPITPDGLVGLATRDGRSLLVLEERKLYPMNGGTPIAAEGLQPHDVFAGWGADGSVFVWRPGEIPVKVFRVDLRAGERRLIKEFTPPDMAGYQGGGNLRVAADGKSFAFSHWQRLSELYLVEGLK